MCVTAPGRPPRRPSIRTEPYHERDHQVSRPSDFARTAAFLPLLTLIALAPDPAKAAPAPAPQESDARAGSANYELAARFAPYRIREMVHSTSVDPRWIEGSDKFWYEWENADGTFFHIVDPGAGSRTLLFDNDRIAAELTRITRDPWDGQHLPIRSIKFIDANTLQFEVESSQDEEEDETDSEMEELDEEEEEGERQRQRTRKRVFHFEYDVNTRVLRELEDWEAPDNHPSWASVSPDGQTVIFARHHNLHMMSGDDYQQFLEARRGKSGDEADETEEGIEVDETQLTTDGEEHYSYAVFERGDTDIERGENVDERKRVSISWSQDSRRFSLIRRDRREVGELWVIHMVGNKRPELESYKYDMPGEETVSQPELLIYDLQDRHMVEVSMPEAWKDHRLFTTSARQFRYPDSEEPFRSLWLSPNSDELHFIRQSRDQHRVDVMVADAATGEARVLVEERLNTYVEFQRLERLASGDMLWWSERDGWAHLYRFGPDGALRNRLTEGPWSVRQVVGIDESTGVVYLQATRARRARIRTTSTCTA